MSISEGCTIVFSLLEVERGQIAYNPHENFVVITETKLNLSLLRRRFILKQWHPQS